MKRFCAGIFFEWHSGSTIACVYFGLFLVALAQHEDVWEPEQSKSDAREMESHYNKLMAMLDLCWMGRGPERCMFFINRYPFRCQKGLVSETRSGFHFSNNRLRLRDQADS